MDRIYCRERFVLLIAAVVFAIGVFPNVARAVPKLHVKMFAGAGSSTFVTRGETLGRARDTRFSWGGGVNLRVREYALFLETGLNFRRIGFVVTDEVADFSAQFGGVIPADVVGRNAKMNSLELPILGGWVPVQKPFWKTYLYAGLVNTFNIRGVIDNGKNFRNRIRFGPKKFPGVPIAIYQAGARMGVQFDLAMFNFDFSYTINLNSVTKTDYRTNVHDLRFNLGYLF
ncbi:MAG: hypothetical protein R3A47_05650 [Polyangiales bacterium]